MLGSVHNTCKMLAQRTPMRLAAGHTLDEFTKTLVFVNSDLT